VIEVLGAGEKGDELVGRSDSVVGKIVVTGVGGLNDGDTVGEKVGENVGGRVRFGTRIIMVGDAVGVNNGTFIDGFSVVGGVGWV